MKKTMKITALVLLAVAAFGCSNEITGPGDGELQSRSIYSRLASWEKVKLTWATLRWSDTGTAFRVVPTGCVLLRNLAYVKDVAIRYTTNGWTSWSEISCSYSSSAADNCEYWVFTGGEYVFTKNSPSQTITDAVSLNFDFAVRYTVNDATCWDSNSGVNYHLDQQVRYLSN